MFARRLILGVCVASLRITATSWATVIDYYPLLVVFRESDVVVQAQAKRKINEEMEYAVVKTYKGKEHLPAEKAPVITVSFKTPPWNIKGISPNFCRPPRVGDEVVLFLKKPRDGENVFLHEGHPPTRKDLLAFWERGAFWLGPRPPQLNDHLGAPEDNLRAMEHVLEAWSLPDERQQVEIMMRDLESKDPRLRWTAHKFMSYTSFRSPKKLEYREFYVKLLSSKDWEQMTLGLTCVQDLKIEEAIPHLIKLAESSDLWVVKFTSLGLRHHIERPEVVDALVRLAKHPNAEVRIRAMIDLHRSDDPKVVAAFFERLNDLDPEVRARVSRYFAHKPEKVRASVTPKLIELLNTDPNPKVKASVIEEFGQQLPVEQRIGYLKEKDLDSAMMAAVLGSLRSTFIARRDKGVEIIRQNEDLFAACVFRADHHMIGFNALLILSQANSPKSRQVIEKAAREHPLAYVRGQAKYLTEKK